MYDRAWQSPRAMGILILGKNVLPKLTLKKVKPRRITSRTRKIAGITIAKATVKLYVGKEKWRTAKAHKKTGKFIFKKLNFMKVKKGKRIRIKIAKPGYRSVTKKRKKK